MENADALMAETKWCFFSWGPIRESNRKSFPPRSECGMKRKRGTACSQQSAKCGLLKQNYWSILHTPLQTQNVAAGCCEGVMDGIFIPKPPLVFRDTSVSLIEIRVYYQCIIHRGNRLSSYLLTLGWYKTVVHKTSVFVPRNCWSWTIFILWCQWCLLCRALPSSDWARPGR